MTGDDEGPAAAFELQSYLPFLIVRAAGRLEAASDALFGQKFNINRRAWRVLAALMIEDGQGVTALADATATEVSTLSRLIDAMEAQGLVEKRRERPKMRSVQVHLSVAGRDLFEAIQPSSLEMGRILTSGLSDRDVRNTIKGLRAIYANIDEAEQFIASVMGAPAPGAESAANEAAPVRARGSSAEGGRRRRA